jgi:flavin-dependent dehydrogenase
LIDLAIIGGGPAGTAAALEARRPGMRVAIWERDRFPRDKVCGEFLSAESLPLLERDIPAALERGAAIRSAEFISCSGRIRAFSLPRPGRGLSRRLMDEALWNAAALAGTECREGEGVLRLRRLDPTTDSGAAWELQSASGTLARTRALLVACGRWWTLEGFPSPARDKKNGAVGPWMGAKAHFQGVALRDAVEMYYFPGGYCGLAPIEDGHYNACCLVHRNLVRDSSASSFVDFAAWLKSVARHPVLETRLRGSQQASETVSTAPVHPARQSADHNGALLAGDASGFLDPFTGDGISMALHSGRLAAEEVANFRSNRGLNPERVAENYRRRLSGAVRRSYLVAGALRALVLAPASVQSSAAAALPWMGTRLLAETRWRG